MRRTVAAIAAACLLVAGCGSHKQKAISPNDCHFAPKGSPHALAAKEGLACPSAVPKGAQGTVSSTGLREMDDSTDVNALASGYPAYAGYTDGLYQSFGAIFARFHVVAQIVGLSVYGGNARGIDLEPSPAAFQNNPYSAGPWARGQIDHTNNKRVVIYTMGAWVPQIEDSLARSGVPRCSTPTQQDCYLEFVAIWDNNPVLYANEAAHQFIDHGPNGENRDRSVYDPAMLFPSAPPPPPPMHYERYAAQSLATPWGHASRQEYAWVFNYDWARPYYPGAFKGLTVNLQVKMRWWANQLAYRIHHSPASENARLYRNERFGQLTARYRGRQCVSWSACVYG